MGGRYFIQSIFNADPLIKNVPPQSRVWRAYVQGYLDFMAGVADPSKMPGKLSDTNSEYAWYSAGGNDAADGLPVDFLNERAPEPPPPEPPLEGGGGEADSVATSGDETLFIPGGDNE